VVGNDLKLVMGKIGLAATSSDHHYFWYRSSRTPNHLSLRKLLDVGIVEYLLSTVDDAVDLLRQTHAVG
jgi:hypothetical protein